MLDEREQNGRKPEPRPRTVVDRLHPAAKREERLTALAELYAGGALSQAEYELQRNQVLDEI
jgi:hypothetical protein